MCIRDSIPAEYGEQVERMPLGGIRLVRRAGVVLARRVVRADLLAHVTPCLLYTSDAADERSSVDLGGRRIIKKKNKQHSQMSRPQT